MMNATELMMKIFKRWGELWPGNDEKRPGGITFNPFWLKDKYGNPKLGLEVHPDNDDLDMAVGESVEDALENYLTSLGE